MWYEGVLIFLTHLFKRSVFLEEDQKKIINPNQMQVLELSKLFVTKDAKENQIKKEHVSIDYALTILLRE